MCEMNRYELNKLKKLRKELLKMQLEERAQKREQHAYKKLALKK